MGCRGRNFAQTFHPALASGLPPGAIVGHQLSFDFNCPTLVTI